MAPIFHFPIFRFLYSWIKLIIEVFGRHSLAAILLTVVAIGLFIWLQKSHPQRTLGNLFLTFGAWAVAVPVLGTLFDIVGGAILRVHSST